MLTRGSHTDGEVTHFCSVEETFVSKKKTKLFIKKNNSTQHIQPNINNQWQRRTVTERRLFYLTAPDSTMSNRRSIHQCEVSLFPVVGPNNAHITQSAESGSSLVETRTPGRILMSYSSHLLKPLIFKNYVSRPHCTIICGIQTKKLCNRSRKSFSFKLISISFDFYYVICIFFHVLWCFLCSWTANIVFFSARTTVTPCLFDNDLCCFKNKYAVYLNWKI